MRPVIFCGRGITKVGNGPRDTGTVTAPANGLVSIKLKPLRVQNSEYGFGDSGCFPLLGQFSDVLLAASSERLSLVFQVVGGREPLFEIADK